MPLPVFLLEFRSAHERNPRPDELSDEQRRHLLRCCLENIERDASMEAVVKMIDDNIETLRKQRETILSHKPDSEKWHDLIEVCVGVEPIKEGEGS